MTTRIEIKVKRGELTLKPTDQDFAVESDPPVTPEWHGDTVVIDTDRLNAHVRMTVLVPASVDRLDVSLGRGPLTMHQLHVDNADVNVGLGTAVIDDVQQGRWDINVGKGDLTVTNAEASFDINVGMGHCQLVHVRGTADINDGFGRVTAAGCEGNFDVNAGKGNVEWTEGGGKLSINAGMGDVRLHDGRGGSVEINAGLGKAFLTDGHWDSASLELGMGDATIASRVDRLAVHIKSRGKIDVSLPENQGARIEASTENGRIISQLNLIPVGHSGPQRGQRLVGVVGDGSGNVLLETRRGNITVSRHNAPPQEHPTPPAPPSADPVEAQRLTILAQLQQGRISVDEAEQLLAHLDKPIA